MQKNTLESFGKYVLFILSQFKQLERVKIYIRRVTDECYIIGIDSVFIVAIISTFLGAVSCIQTAYNMVSPFVPNYIIGTLVRDLSILELSPTIISIVLAGKVGSHIAGELGTMRITEQIDALEVMGINSSSYLVLPKIIASFFMFPMLVVMAIFLSILGGYIAGTFTGILTETEYVYGLRYSFVPFNISFALIKTVVFSFLISSISAFKGFYVRGGALEVGIASTRAVTSSCIAILLADYLLAQLLL